MYTFIAIFLLNITGYDATNQLIMDENYDGASQLLQKLDPFYNYNDYYYYSLICHYRLNQRDLAEKDIIKLNDSFNPFSRRQQAMIQLIDYNLRNWTNDGLDDISREMSKSSDRLKTLDPNAKTQNIQKGIVDKLSKLIDEMENPPKGSPGNPSDPKDGKPRLIPGNGNGDPAPDSTIMGGNGKGLVTEKKLQQIAQQWGGLPPQERAKVVEELTRDLPPKYKPMIDQYFKALNKQR